MLAYRYRFHGHNSLRFVYKNGTAVRSQHLTMKHIPNQKRQSPRVAVVVSKKIYKKAVGRNRIRRRLYETLRHELSKIRSNTDLVLIVTSADIVTMTQMEIEAEVANSLKSAGVYQTSSKVV